MSDNLPLQTQPPVEAPASHAGVDIILESVLPAASTPAKAVKLNTELHVRLLGSGKVRPSTFESAMAALERLRRTRAG